MLSNHDILGYREHGLIVIEPFEPRNLGSNSYDVRLGEWYYREQRPVGRTAGQLYNPYSEDQVKRVWGESLQAATFEWNNQLPSITPDTKVILVDPGETILAHTEEFIGGRDSITTMMKARSSFGRNFIEVCKCAGLGDVGYINRWTMEITNNSRFYQIPLVVGRRIAQITFFKTGSASDYARHGKYQSTRDLATLVGGWRPEMMLPRLHLDWELREGK